MTSQFRRWGLFLLTSVLGTHIAQGGLTGASIDVTANYPDVNTVYADGGTTTVSAAVEYPYGAFAAYSQYFQMDVTNTQLILTWDVGASFVDPANFDGFVLTELSGSAITAATADPTSDFSPTSVNVVGGNKLQLNYGGVAISGQGARSIINIQTIPEPAALSTLAVTLPLFGRRKRV